MTTTRTAGSAPADSKAANVSRAISRLSGLARGRLKVRVKMPSWSSVSSVLYEDMRPPRRAAGPARPCTIKRRALSLATQNLGCRAGRVGPLGLRRILAPIHLGLQLQRQAHPQHEHLEVEAEVDWGE